MNMFRRHLSPFAFAVLALSACTIDPPNGPDGGGGGGGAPPAGAPAGAPPAPPAGGAPAGDNTGQFKPEWLNDRIAQAKRSAEAELLKTLGVTDMAAAQKLLDDGKKAADANKSELQRKDDELAATKTVAAEAKTYREVLVKQAAASLATLPEAARASIVALAGDDPVKQLEAIELAKAMAPAAAAPPAGTPPGTPPAQGAPGQPKPPVPPAANTTGAAGGPPSAPGSPPDHVAVWKDLQAKGNPLAAAHYYLANQTAIVDQQQKTST